MACPVSFWMMTWVIKPVAIDKASGFHAARQLTYFAPVVLPARSHLRRRRLRPVRNWGLMCTGQDIYKLPGPAKSFHPQAFPTMPVCPTLIIFGAATWTGQSAKRVPGATQSGT